MCDQITEQEVLWMKETLSKIISTHETLIEGQSRLIDRQDHLDECIDSLREAIKKRQESEDRNFKEIKDMISSVVPNGDFDGHRNYHVLQMRRWNWWSKIKEGVALKVFEYGAIAVTVWFAHSLFNSAKIAIGN